MPLLILAGDEQLASIYRESHTLWGAGLSFEEYLGLWRDLQRTAWARRHAGLYAWTDEDGALLSSVKLYRPELSIRGHRSRVTVIGALFTPSNRRRRGHATNLVRAVVARAREQGDPLVLLFSDIGAGFYEALGFRALPAEEQFGALPLDPRVPRGWSLRPWQEADLEPVRLAHLDFCGARPLATIRDVDHWRFLLERSNRFFERLRDARLCASHQVALDDGRFAGYLITVEGRGEWNVREVGAVGGDVEIMAAILRVGAADARDRGHRGFYGWLPPGLPERLEDWGFRNRTRRRAVPMLLGLDPTLDLSALRTPADAYLPFQDQF